LPATPSQSANPSVQLSITHWPMVQRASAFASAHALPHAPQFAMSDNVSMHVWSQQTSPPSHAWAATPDSHATHAPSAEQNGVSGVPEQSSSDEQPGPPPPVPPVSPVPPVPPSPPVPAVPAPPDVPPDPPVPPVAPVPPVPETPPSLPPVPPAPFGSGSSEPPHAARNTAAPRNPNRGSRARPKTSVMVQRRIRSSGQGDRWWRPMTEAYQIAAIQAGEWGTATGHRARIMRRTPIRFPVAPFFRGAFPARLRPRLIPFRRAFVVSSRPRACLPRSLRDGWGEGAHLRSQHRPTCEPRSMRPLDLRQRTDASLPFSPD